jgi:hypothetical protein
MVLQKSPIPPCAGWSHVPAKRVVPSPCKKLPSGGPLSLQTDMRFFDGLREFDWGHGHNSSASRPRRVSTFCDFPATPIPRRSSTGLNDYARGTHHAALHRSARRSDRGARTRYRDPDRTEGARRPRSRSRQQRRVAVVALLEESHPARVLPVSFARLSSGRQREAIVGGSARPRACSRASTPTSGA